MLPYRSPSRPLLAVALLAGLASPANAQPGPASPSAPSARTDVVTAAIAEASARSGVPASWIRAVIRAESFGDARAVSPKGAIGLMQLMPATFATLRAQLRLGPDPFDVRDNVMAGAAYLRLMYDRYGLVGMIGAYNAGPERWEAHLAGVRPLPAETLAYLARLAPVLGFAAPSMQVGVPAALAPSPLEAPLFVALQSTSRAASSAAERQRVLAIIDRNATVVLPSGDGSAAAEAPFSPPTPSGVAAPSATHGGSSQRQETDALRPRETLFVASTPRGAAR